MHAEVTLRVEVTVAKYARLTPPMESLAFFVVEKGHDTFLVVDIGLLADIRILHLVDGLLEELLVLSDKQFLDVLQSTFSLGNRVDLDTFNKNLDQGC